MSGSNRQAILLKCSAIVGVLLVFTGLVRSERLPIKTYTTSEGLAQNAVNRIFADSRGFLWFCTDEGLSRFDGYTFTNYTTAHGLSHPIVKDVLETRSGIYWVGTGVGVCRFKPKGDPRPSTSAQRYNQSPSDSVQTPEDDSMFVLCNTIDQSQTGTVNVLLEDRTGIVWCGASNGLYRLDHSASGQITLRSEEIGLSRRVDPDVRVRALLEDSEGCLWIGSGSGLYRRWSDGRTERYTTERGLPDNEVRSLMMDAEGQLWVGTRRGVSRIDRISRRSRIIEFDNASSEYLNRNTRSLFQTSTGELLAGTTTSLLEFVPQGNRDASSFRHYLGERRLNNLFVQTMTEDRDGNLWIGTDNGALKLARNGFTTYTEADGLSEARVSAVFESRDGQIGAMTLFSSAMPISWFDGKRFNAIRPILPRHIQYFGWGWNQLLLQDHAGEWWLPTGEGLVRYPKVSHVQQLATTSPKAIYTTRNGLVSNDVFRLYEDSHGDVWVATYSEARSGISRWERNTDTFHTYGEADGLARALLAHAFTEDRAGNLWIAFEADTVARFGDGRFTVFASEQGPPAGFFCDVHLDNAGRLWIASTTGGLTRVDEPDTEHPRFFTYTTAQGLSSNNINCITEDLYGRLYVGTGRGLDRLEPATGRVKPFTAADGLISGEVLVSFRDQKGDLWFGGKSGLSRLSPRPDPPRSPPPVLITGLRVAGQAQRISALGETEIPSVELGPDKDQIQIDFVALGFSPGEGLRYQYKLEGASEDWSQLADRRTVNFANLAPGSYRFLVRAVNGDGVMSDPPASYSFTIYPALWKRGWFISINAVLLLLIAYALYQYRVRRLLELERVRTRIASDLHDDIGANLTKIGILSEVLRQQSNGTDGAMTEPLSSIARISRESVASMSDIVWAINPRRDTLRDLTRRMREFSSEIFANRDIEFELRAPSPDTNLKLGADLRRAVFLIFKEAVNNIVRHSDCDKAVIELRVEGSALVLTIEDDGNGFDATRESGGNGLANIRNRAASMRGKVEILSDRSSGTRIVLRLPIRQRKASFAKPWF